jgi:hypothetical protein
VSASSSPFPALSLSGSLLRVVSSSGGTTLVSFGGGYSPFRGGDLVVSYAYQESLDTSTDTRSRIHGPTLRWNIRPGWFFNAGWSFQKTTAPAQSLTGQAATANLVGTYR